MRKGEIDYPEMIAALAFFLVMIAIVLPAFVIWFKSSGQKFQCEWTGTVATISKMVSFDLYAFPLKCPTKNMSIGSYDLQSRVEEAKKQVQIYHKDPRYVSVAAVYPDTNSGYAHWALDSYVGREMKECVDKTVRADFNPKEWTNALKVDTLCVVCSTIDFREDVPAQLQGKPLYLKSWLQSNSVGGKTYYDDITQSMKPKMGIDPMYDTSRKYAVVLLIEDPDVLAANLKKIPGVTATAGGIFSVLNYLGANLEVKPDKIVQLYLWPWADIARPIESGGLGCEKQLG